MAYKLERETLNDLNALIVLPKTLTADDGRQFRITKWTPTVSFGALATVSIEAIISGPTERQENVKP